MQHLAFTIEEVMASVNLGRTKVYEIINSGLLPARKLGKRTLVLKEDLDAFLNNLKKYPTQSNKTVLKGQ